MKLVKITDELVIDVDLIVSIEYNKEKRVTVITLIKNEIIIKHKISFDIIRFDILTEKLIRVSGRVVKPWNTTM